MADEVALGGNLNDAVRIGDTVRRRTGRWTPAVHLLLRFLERSGFPAPRVLGTDAQGREILRFIPGEDWHSPEGQANTDTVFAEPHLLAAASMLRRYHEVVGDFSPPADAKWRVVAPTAHEIICHNDWSPWNALLRDGQLAAMLDWDLAGPGTRLWDLANAVYCWVPFFASHVNPSLTDQVHRMRLFLDTYGLEDRSAFLPTLRDRLRFVGELIAREARGGDPGMQRLVAMNVPRKMFEDDVAWLDRNWTTLERAL